MDGMEGKCQGLANVLLGSSAWLWVHAFSFMLRCMKTRSREHQIYIAVGKQDKLCGSL
jgi:hypothetical protein